MGAAYTPGPWDAARISHHYKQKAKRSLAEAFPDERAPAVEVPMPPMRLRLADLAVLAVCIGCLLAVAAMAAHGWLPGA